MKKVKINGKHLINRNVLHETMASAMQFPAYYGKNLDALHDCLGECCEPTTLIVTHTDRLLRNLGDYGDTFLRVLTDSAESNKNLTVVLYR
mgnify:CR=1 FL=1